ncbi:MULTISPECIES: DUF1349 domain-containing protein [Arthrobacter]|uniref:DUF1349 domain-containing protein n=2 Tax=Arthrobacter TaxID=1663 RepID=A0ABU9KHL2_9MICC|nr:DUF1349 domain-containing protein [Arthrobacter sp. YJM1]MDP5226256.1 DUF1349 domain-containing protein [Arthrobacter sp. YJM1]
MTSFSLPGVPHDFRPLLSSGGRAEQDGDAVTLHAGAGDDLFRRPGTDRAVATAKVFGFAVDGDFRLEAEVQVEFLSDFDSAVLVGYLDERHWFKLCAERDELGSPRIMSVVTRERSDDATGIHLDGGPVRLRISRSGTMVSLHYCTDGARWNLARYFDFPVTGSEGALRAGIAVQSPRGTGTSATFRDVRFSADGVTEVRSGE